MRIEHGTVTKYKIDFQTTGASYLGLEWGKVGKFLVGDALEFYADANVEDYIQILGILSIKSVPMCLANELVVILKSLPTKGKFLFASKDAGTILKHAPKAYRQ